MNAAGGTRRLFFALWPDSEIRAGIERLRRTIAAPSKRVVPTHNLHATLVFLGNRPAELFDSIEAAAGVAARSSVGFELVLDRFGWFSGARVAWLGAEAVPEGSALVAHLQRALADSGVETGARAWTPHVTLFRDVRRRPRFPDPEPLTWPVASFALIESIPNRRYQVLRTWPLE